MGHAQRGGRHAIVLNPPTSTRTNAVPLGLKPVGGRYHPNESSCGSMLEVTCGGRSTVGNLWKKINQSFRGIVPEVCCEIMKIGMVQ